MRVAGLLLASFHPPFFMENCMFNLTQLTTQGVIDAITLSDTPFDGEAMFFGLYTDGPSVNPPVLSSAFTAPALTVIARVELTAWTEDDLQGDGSIQKTSPVIDFTYLAFTEPITFKGMHVSNSATVGNVIAWQDFDTPIPLLTSMSHARFVIRLTIGIDGKLTMDFVRVDE